MLDYIEYLADILTFGELEVRVKTVDMLQKDGMIDRLEERLNRLSKEVDARDETKSVDMNAPVWFDGTNINEALFCDEF